MKIYKNEKWHINPNVFFGSSFIIWFLVCVSLLFHSYVSKIFLDLFSFITNTFSWLYIGAVTFYLIFCFGLLFTRYGDIPLGRDGERPEFSFLSWIAMVFSAGMGIGILFYGVAEPIMHLKGSSPLYSHLDVKSQAMSITFFHWGLNAWGIYALMGLALAYGHYRKGRKLSIRYCLYPLLKERVEGKIGDLVDILAVVGTLFGVATSLGFGVIQINSGLNYLFQVPKNISVQVFLILGITLVATLSVVSGVDKGIRKLSEVNIILALILLLFVFFAGNTISLLNHLMENLGNYLHGLAGNTLRTGAREGQKWMSSWTIFYWGWWIAWSPFVGMFIARISRGRTIREFLLTILILPTLFTFVWMTIFGESAISQIAENKELVAAIENDLSISLFVFLKKLPLSSFTSLLGVFVIFTFFVTSSDSGSLVIDMITAGGHPSPPVHQKVYWAFMEGIVAAILLGIGGLKALQTASINAALPFSIILIFMAISLVIDLKNDYTS